MNTSRYSPLAQYRCVGAYGSVENADPHRLVALLFDGMAEALGGARAAIERGDTVAKGTEIRKAAGILDALRSSLNLDEGGEMATNLARLYDYMGREITRANLHDASDALTSATQVNETLRAAWQSIPEEARSGNLAA